MQVSLSGVSDVLNLLNSRRDANVFLSQDETSIISFKQVEYFVLEQLQAFTEENNPNDFWYDRSVTLSTLASQLNISEKTMEDIVNNMATCGDSGSISVVRNGNENFVLSDTMLTALCADVKTAVLQSEQSRCDDNSISVGVTLALLCSDAGAGMRKSSMALLCALPLHFVLHHVLKPLLPHVVTSCNSGPVGNYKNFYCLTPAECAVLDPSAIVLRSEMAHAQCLCAEWVSEHAKFCGAAGVIVPPLSLSGSPVMLLLRGLVADISADTRSLCNMLGGGVPLASGSGSGCGTGCTEVGSGAESVPALQKMCAIVEYLMELADTNDSGSSSLSTNVMADAAIDLTHMQDSVLCEGVLYHRSFLRGRYEAASALCRQTKGSLFVLDIQGTSAVAFMEQWWFRQAKLSIQSYLGGVLACCWSDTVASEADETVLTLVAERYLVLTDGLKMVRAALVDNLASSEQVDAQWFDFGDICKSWRFAKAPELSAGSLAIGVDVVSAVFDHILDQGEIYGRAVTGTLRECLERDYVVVDSSSGHHSDGGDAGLVVFQRALLDSLVTRAAQIVYQHAPGVISSTHQMMITSIPVIRYLFLGMVPMSAGEEGGYSRRGAPTESLWVAAEPLLLGALTAAQEAHRYQWGRGQSQRHLLTDYTPQKFPALFQFSCSHRSYTVIGSSGASGSGGELTLALELERDARCLDAWNCLLGLVCSQTGSGSAPASWLVPSGKLAAPGADIYNIPEGAVDSGLLELHNLILDEHCVPLVLLLTCYACALNGIHCGALFAADRSVGHCVARYLDVDRNCPIGSLCGAAANEAALALLDLLSVVWEDSHMSVILTAEPLFSVLATLWMLVLPTEIISAMTALVSGGDLAHEPSVCAIADCLRGIRPNAGPGSLWAFLRYMRRSAVPQLGLVLLHQPTTFDTLKKKDRQAFVVQHFVAPAVHQCTVDAARACCLAADCATSGGLSVDYAAALFVCNMLLDLGKMLTSLVLCRLAQAGGSRRPRFALVGTDDASLDVLVSGIDVNESEIATVLAQLRELRCYLQEKVMPVRLAALYGIEHAEYDGGWEVLLQTCKLSTSLAQELPVAINDGGWCCFRPAGGVVSPIWSVLVALTRFAEA